MQSLDPEAHRRRTTMAGGKALASCGASTGRDRIRLMNPSSHKILRMASNFLHRHEARRVTGKSEVDFGYEMVGDTSGVSFR